MNMSQIYTIKDSELEINGNKKVVKFSHPIYKVIEFKDCLVVMLAFGRNVHMNQNVFGVSFSGEVLWQIHESKKIRNDIPYTNISKREDLLTAYNLTGILYWLEPKTGKVIKEEFIK